MDKVHIGVSTFAQMPLHMCQRGKTLVHALEEEMLSV